MSASSNENSRPPAAGHSARSLELDAHFRGSFRVLWLVAVGIVGEPSLAEDVVQEAALIAMNKLDRYQPGSNFGAWVSQIVRNVAFNRVRSERRRRTTDLRIVPAAAADRDPGPGEPLAGSYDRLVDSEFSRRVLDALADFAEIPRACLLLRTIEGLSYAQISQLLEIPEGTAMSHVHRTRQAVRERLLPAWEQGPASRSQRF